MDMTTGEIMTLHTGEDAQAITVNTGICRKIVPGEEFVVRSSIPKERKVPRDAWYEPGTGLAILEDGLKEGKKAEWHRDEDPDAIYTVTLGPHCSLSAGWIAYECQNITVSAKTPEAPEIEGNRLVIGTRLKPELEEELEEEDLDMVLGTVETG